MDEITRQARQGSMAALIQLMNERLADSGIRTRAMFADGVLQILCESTSAEPLVQSQLVPYLKEMLQELSPRNYRRIRINARIAREQQLLWLEEISRDPENQLLWSEEIQLTPPNWLTQLSRHLQDRQSATSPKKPDRVRRERAARPKSYWQGVGGGILLSLLMLGGLWTWWRWRALEPQLLQSVLSPKSGPVSSPPVAATPEPFVEAVRLAETSALKGQTAKTAAEWLDLAARWQRASDLMQSVPESDPRYKMARDRTVQYRKNSEMAQKQAQRLP